MTGKRCLGLDTSNYTTSTALFDGADGYQLGRLLDVEAGSLGLRQSDALFQHVKRLPELFDRLRREGRLEDIAAVGASVKPRWVEGSYMPCFLAGETAGRILADTLGVPFFPCAHQQGHIAAVAWGAGRLEMLDKPLLAWHLSGGTTELLYVEPDGTGVLPQKIGGTSDISAGQLIDRTGVALGLDFPAGRALDTLSRTGRPDRGFAVKISNFTFSFSGMENKAKDMAAAGEPAADVARFIVATVARTIRRVTDQALEQYPGLPVLCSGGVASNSILREVMSDAVFAPPVCSADNALGVAVLTHRALTMGGTV
ncbi:MAG TPA: DNA-binding protein [Candidatus Intestinimonas merdavium]|uniref:N(6)-L-threonylcarbamoyladenine synthase n=1 Tax=Candidatus Intestinimonas merdavium TaxID=2838622 RepID=A0A9D2CDA1_9FIRM|nr:DNA-binding protein [Candidatus Intestinimonas merdavium]